MDCASNQDLGELQEDVEQTWVSSSKKQARKRKRSKVVITTRASSRISNDGRTMLEKATQTASDKDNTSKGTTSPNQFLVLNTLANEYI